MAFLSQLVDQLITLFGLSSLEGPGKVIHYFLTASSKIFLMMILITMAIGLFRSFINPVKVKALLNKAGPVMSHVLASFIGAVTPFCSCSSVPIFIGFLESGIPLGATFAFLITSPIVNEAAIAMLWIAFGWQVALIYTITGILIGIISGLIIHKLHLEHLVEDYVHMKTKELDPVHITSLKSRFAFAWQETKLILSKVWAYMLVGIMIGAFIYGWTPDQFLLSYAGPDNPFAVIIGVVIGVPIYTSNVVMIPIIETLIGKGMGVGTALAFMMAASALSLPEIIMLRKVLKAKLVKIFVAITSLGIIFVGYLFNITLTGIL